MSNGERYDVVIVGGGVAGCAAARELAVDRDVLVLEKGQIAGEASGLAAGLIAPTLFYPERPDAARHANAFFREFDGTGNFEFVERPRIELITPARESAARERADKLSDRGFPVTFLEASTAAERYPRFDFDGFRGVVEYGDTGWLDPYTYATSLAESAEERGADVETGVAVSDVLVEGDTIVGVDTDDGRYRAPTVVLATGWRTKELLPDAIDLPLEPFKLQCLSLEPSFELDESFPLGRVADEELYFRPEHNGTVLFGGGEYVTDKPDSAVGGGEPDGSFTEHVATTVPEFLDGFEAARVIDGWTGIDAATPDARPIIDAPAAGPDGLVVATGFNGLGMVSSPIAATGVRSLVTGESAPFDVEAFALDRYDEIPDSFELHGTFDAADA